MRLSLPLSQHTREKICVCGNQKSASGVVLCQHHPALTRESPLPARETRPNQKKSTLCSNLPIQRKTTMNSTISNLTLQVESTTSNQLLHRLCNGHEFLRAWSQSVVLVLEQLDKMARTCRLG